MISLPMGRWSTIAGCCLTVGMVGCQGSPSSMSPVGLDDGVQTAAVGSSSRVTAAFADASFTSIDPVSGITTFVFVAASSERAKLGPGSPVSNSGAALRITQTDQNGNVIRTLEGNLPGTFDLGSSQSNATLMAAGSLPALDPFGAPIGLVETSISMAWIRSTEPVRARFSRMLKGGGLLDQAKESGIRWGASAVGTLNLGSSVVPLEADFGTLLNTRQSLRSINTGDTGMALLFEKDVPNLSMAASDSHHLRFLLELTRSSIFTTIGDPNGPRIAGLEVVVSEGSARLGPGPLEPSSSFGARLQIVEGESVRSFAAHFQGTFDVEPKLANAQFTGTGTIVELGEDGTPTGEPTEASLHLTWQQSGPLLRGHQLGKNVPTDTLNYNLSAEVRQMTATGSLTALGESFAISEVATQLERFRELTMYDCSVLPCGSI